eukprot:CAMPEP_0185765600 /NCGR_PEP_ID=MMETSP1174-20130828/30878_1 /TAXON_ID=35687 /ORGANISM="Dictyocha speculum, Strain CCMP1381" /LENGTH=205 /DNA_ID=CAMNT_0028448841 /DNA_START=154 /DNA_END=771 /DNA_ORIENTATION=+
MSSIPDRQPIIVTGNNVEVTPAMLEYVNKKLDKVLDKHRQVVTKCDVHLTVVHNPRVKESHRAEVTLAVKGLVMRTSEDSENMYATIDAVADSLARKLRKFKERKDKKQSSSAIRDADALNLSEDEEVESPEEDAFAGAVEIPRFVDMSIVKQKSFNMEPITVEDAVLCLEYIDHDFYVFRNKETGEVNVVYKRNSGGVGHIEPE